MPGAPPIAVGSTIEDVVRAMGTPDEVSAGSNQKPSYFKYGTSSVSFGENTQTVTSWYNTGNLYVS